jgi:hypothetical protein
MDKQSVIEEIKEILPRVAPGAEVILYESGANVEEEHPERIIDLIVVLDKKEVTKADEDAILTPLEAIEDRSNYEMAILPFIFTRGEWNYHRLYTPFYDTIMNRRGGRVICR